MRHGPGDTQLHWAAAYSENEVIVALLLDASADPMARNLIDNTPLHLAANYTTNRLIIEILLGAGADPLAEGHRGRTPVESARSNPNTEVSYMLQTAAAQGAGQVE